MRRYINTATPVALTSGVNDAAAVLSVGSTVSFPDPPFLLGLERGTGNEEVVLCTSKDATNFNVTRGYDGTTAVSHDLGSLVEHTVAAIDYREAGVVRITTSARNSLSGSELWVGRTIYNTTSEKLQFRTASATWVNVGPAVGSLSPYAGATAPLGTLLCNGQAVSRTTYDELFTAIGTTYGVGDGVTTFNIPDLRQRFPLGVAASGTGSTLGGVGGTIDHTHVGASHVHTNPTTSTSGSHTHTQGAATGSAGSHSHTVTGGTGTDLGSIGANVNNYNFRVVGDKASHTHTTGSTGSHDHSVPAMSSGGSHTHTQGDTGAAGTGATGTANPPFIALNYVIYS